MSRANFWTLRTWSALISFWRNWYGCRRCWGMVGRT